MTQLVNYVLTIESCTPNLKENPHKNLLVGFIQSVKTEKKNVIHKNTLTIFRKKSVSLYPTAWVFPNSEHLS